MSVEPLKAPFPYFGGKSTVSADVWVRFGDVRNYVEPFFGSGAMLLNRPQPFEGSETVNDKDGLVSNFWRAVQAAPDDVAFHADWPVNENDLHGRHVWLVGEKDSLQTRLDGDPEFFDAKVAGWWCWGMCCWIGSGFCSGNGPWRSVADAEGVRQLVHVGTAGQGVNRKLVHVGDAGKGVNRKRVHVGNAGQGEDQGTPGRESTASESTLGTPGRTDGIYSWMQELSTRLKRVRVCSGDWSRVCGPSVTVKHGLTAVFLDPPYADSAGRQADLYREDSSTVAHAVREWAIQWGDDPRMRIALCGYDGEHLMPESWTVFDWKARGGYGSQGDDDEAAGRANSKKERIWFSPHCLKPSRETQRPLFAMGDAT